MDNTETIEPSIVPVNQDALSGREPSDLDSQNDPNVDQQSEEIENAENSENNSLPSQDAGETSVPVGDTTDDSKDNEETLTEQSEDNNLPATITPVNPDALAEGNDVSATDSTAVSTTAKEAAADSKPAKKVKKKAKSTSQKTTSAEQPQDDPFADDAEVNFQGQHPYAEFQDKLRKATLDGSITLPAPQVAAPVNLTLKPVDVDALSDVDLIDTTDNVDPEGLPYRAWWNDDDDEAPLSQAVVGLRDQTIPSEDGSFLPKEKTPLQSVVPWFLTQPEREKALDLININLFEV